MSRPLICLVTNRRALALTARTLTAEIHALERQIDEASSAGVDLVQVRERDLEAADLRRLVGALLKQKHGQTRLVVNDRADVALAAGAEGVHLRGDGPSAAIVRTLAPAGWTIGRSIHSSTEAAQSAAADYLVFGMVFRSHSKAGDHPVAGLEALAAAAAATVVPVLAIGGVTTENVAACRAAGAAGVAAIEMFLPPGASASARGPERAVAIIRAAWQGSALE